MGKGRIQTAVLTDIANAIRSQNGTGTLYRPADMAAAVEALDGEDAGGAVSEGYLDQEWGLVDAGVFSDLADAIRAQNGSSAAYLPGEMAAAILALSWVTDTGVKARALYLEDGTIEFNYRDGRSSDLGLAVAECWEVDTGGYSSYGARPWNDVAGDLTRAVFDDDWAGAGVEAYDYWFCNCTGLTEVEGFEQVSGLSSAAYMFAYCSALETIWAESFDASALTAASAGFYGCYRLVGQTGFVADTDALTSSKHVAAFSFGDSGVLTDPDADERVWIWGHAYSDGELVVTCEEEPDDAREALASGRLCANAAYDSSSAMPWHGARTSITSATLSEDLGGLSSLNMCHWFQTATALASAEGLGNLPSVQAMGYAFASCTAIEELDLRGFDPSCLTDVNYAFSSCTALTTIWADSDWELPSTASGSATFYNSKALVGGNGTAYSSSRYSYKYLVIDSEDEVGYLTAG